MDYFISDLHFGHKNIIKYCNRPFSSVEEMDNALIEKWNGKVDVSDNVFVIGDVALNANGIDRLKELKGKKHLIVGNHDFPILKEIEKLKVFETIDYTKILYVQSKTITLSHFPMYSFIGDYLIYGHVHNNEHDKSFKAMRDLGNAFNASVEINNYIPVTFDELKDNNRITLDLYHK